ncbi:hypothetical protein J2128_002010 [Methanomicrobium sp. W14]|uniref:DUF7226 domain-containing protein n=1 Tax=Methanomicrobium sp. W14 TaxID=2817839 RepID=UPI001AE8E36D|nr:hypothetical protein [Methanomicrobium sp. W14]MBP2134044.1 hypothetical protein [Methanomicrobium sp. W14]
MQKKNSGTAQNGAITKKRHTTSFFLGSELPVDLSEMLLYIEERPHNPVKVPFPQANDLDKILDMVVSFDEKWKTSEQISEQFKFNGRQGEYYANAAIYLDFLERDPHYKSFFLLTRLGNEVKNYPLRRYRNKILLVQLMRKPVFRSAAMLLKECGYDLKKVTRESVAQIIKDNYSNYSMVTCRRRASTVISWIKWVCLNFKFKSE